MMSSELNEKVINEDNSNPYKKKDPMKTNIKFQDTFGHLKEADKNLDLKLFENKSFQNLGTQSFSLTQFSQNLPSLIYYAHLLPSEKLIGHKNPFHNFGESGNEYDSNKDIDYSILSTRKNPSNRNYPCSTPFSGNCTEHITPLLRMK